MTRMFRPDMFKALGGHANGDVNGPSQPAAVLSSMTHMRILADPAKALQVVAAAKAFPGVPRRRSKRWQGRARPTNTSQRKKAPYCGASDC